MMGYEKRIVYFDLIERDEKMGNAGFAKIIIQNGQLRLTINIAGLHKTDTLRGEIMLLQIRESLFLDSIQLKEGKCTYSCLFTGEMLQEKNVSPDDLYGICIRIDEARYLKALWGKEPISVLRETEPSLIMEDETSNLALIEQVESEAEVVSPIVSLESKAEDVSPVMQVENEVEAIPIETAQLLVEPIKLPPENKLNPPVFGSQKKRYKNAEQIMDDKWKQLEKVFPHLHPFGDGREYLSVAPKDFIVLTREFQCLANNSFLLHGYYNYRHIILGKIMPQGIWAGEKEEEKYYLGVPGVFYEREKAVALMFGFESFECAHEPAETGAFGYYMKRVEI